MSGTQTIRAAIRATMLTIPEITLVHEYERYADRRGALSDYYQPADAHGIDGWFIRRTGTQVTEISNNSIAQYHRWQITGYRSFEDQAASELAFDAVLDDLIQAFVIDETLSGVVEGIVVDGAAGLQLDSSGPVMFGGVLCHQAIFSLITCATHDPGQIATDAFSTANTEWDMSGRAASLPDAEDSIRTQTGVPS